MQKTPTFYTLIGVLLGVLLMALVVLAFPLKKSWYGAAKHERGAHVKDEDMSLALAGMTGAEFEEAFMKMMIEHHEDAVRMAELVPERAVHEELKKLGTNILNAQNQEIQAMRDWLQAWGYVEGERLTPVQ